MAPAQVRGRHSERELREPAEERLEGHLALHPGQRRTETVMDTVPESEMTGLIPFEVQIFGTGIAVLVPVGRRQANNYLFTGGNLHTSEGQWRGRISKRRIGVSGRRNEGTLQRPWESPWDRRQLGQLVRVAKQGDETVSDEAGGVSCPATIS